MRINIKGCLEDILCENKLNSAEKEALKSLIYLLSLVSYERLKDIIMAEVEDRLKIFPCPIGSKVYYVAQVVKPGYPDPKIEPEMFLCDFKEEWADGYGKYVFLESEKDKAIKKLIELQSKNEK